MLLTINDVYIVIDALDEYKGRSTNRSNLLAWIQDCRKGVRNVHLLVTSRPEDDIKTSIEEWATAEDMISLHTDHTV